ncbi:Hypothetical predicted protein [Olea europaea subsp. europaea]|uniref:Uncharacterized protein n=1 Tax=Olea europaea subsp. europaea TaxID=158383 RepID=A0A8S0T6K3_OLEEU|nr:Hypothetical predicted protein [Olea europaea subsp. europaea]
MEDPENSSVSKQVSLRGTEESGWTTYLEDFAYSQNSYSMDSFRSPSLVSDAAWNGPNNNDQVIQCPSFAVSQFPRRLNFKNTDSKKFSCDDLEDTASSPVNSPKISSLKPRNVNYKRSEGGSNNFSIQGTDERDEMNFADGRSGEYMEQKKREFCLVPVAVLMNHLR